MVPMLLIGTQTAVLTGKLTSGNLQCPAASGQACQGACANIDTIVALLSSIRCLPTWAMGVLPVTQLLRTMHSTHVVQTNTLVKTAVCQSWSEKSIP